MAFSMSEKIRELLNEENITMKELSDRLGKSNQNMANKIKRDNFSMNELAEIAAAMNCQFEATFITKSGKRI